MYVIYIDVIVYKGMKMDCAKIFCTANFNAKIKRENKFLLNSIFLPTDYSDIHIAHLGSMHEVHNIFYQKDWPIRNILL